MSSVLMFPSRCLPPRRVIAATKLESEASVTVMVEARGGRRSRPAATAGEGGGALEEGGGPASGDAEADPDIVREKVVAECVT